MDFLAKAKAVFSIIRPEITLAIGATVIVGEIVALRGLPPFSLALLGFLTGFFISIPAMVLNDYFDLEVDRINEPNRPLPKGTISLHEAKILGVITTLAGFITAALLGLLTFVISVALWIISFLYNWKLKETGFLGNLCVSTSALAVFIFGGAAVKDPLNPLLMTMAVMAFFMNLGGEVAGGIMDAEGDAKRNIRSIARIHGSKRAAYLASILLFSAILLTFVPYFLGWLRRIYLLLIVPTDLMIAYSSLGFIRSQKPKEVKRKKNILFLGMLLGLMAFIVGGLYTAF